MSMSVPTFPSLFCGYVFVFRKVMLGHLGVKVSLQISNNSGKNNIYTQGRGAERGRESKWGNMLTWGNQGEENMGILLKVHVSHTFFQESVKWRGPIKQGSKWQKGKSSDQQRGLKNGDHDGGKPGEAREEQHWDHEPDRLPELRLPWLGESLG